MCRGFFVSCRYSFNCWSESFRPNQVFHQNRNGIRQISHAVTKKRIFWLRDMPGLPVLLVSVDWSGTGLAAMFYRHLLHHIGVEYAILLQIMRNRVLGQKWRQN